MRTSKHWKKITPKPLRKELGMNQTEFWARVGTTQSGGCRYEMGRDVPPPIQKLLHLAYGDKIMPALAEMRGITVGQLMTHLQAELSALAKAGKI